MTDSEKRLRIYMENRPALVDYATLIVGSRASAEDAVQEAYFRFVAPPKPPAIKSPAFYLFRVVRNIAIDMARRVAPEARREALYAPLIEAEARAPLPEDAAIQREALALVQAALDELPETTREAFRLKRLDGETFADIGARLGISKSSAHRLTQEALAHIMRQLHEQHR